MSRFSRLCLVWLMVGPRRVFLARCCLGNPTFRLFFSFSVLYLASVSRTCSRFCLLVFSLQFYHPSIMVPIFPRCTTPHSLVRVLLLLRPAFLQSLMSSRGLAHVYAGVLPSVLVLLTPSRLVCALMLLRLLRTLLLVVVATSRFVVRPNG